MRWEDLIKLVQEKGLEEKPINAYISIQSEEAAQRDLINLELKLLEPKVRHNRALLMELLHPQF